MIIQLYVEKGTCYYSSGDWNVNLINENCTISSPVVGDGSNLNIYGDGTFTLNADISGFNTIHIDSSATVTCQSGCFKQT